MTSQDAIKFLAEGYCGRLATADAGGQPYCVPLLYLYFDDCIYVHNARGQGHLRKNLDANPKACFEVDRAGAVYDYGRFQCDSTVAYTSVIVFGTVRIVEEEALKLRFCDALMRKYRHAGPSRPAGFYPRLAEITVYEMSIDRLTGKRTPLLAESDRWPAVDRTKTPNAGPPRS